MDDRAELTEETLWAFVDHQADAATILRVLAAERRDPALAERIRTMREETAAIAEAWDATLKPAPPHLSQMVRKAAATRPAFGGPRQTLIAMAASVMVAVGLGAAIADWRFTDRLAALEEEKTARRELVSQLLQETLELRLSGEAEAASRDVSGFSAKIMPTQTYKSRSGHWRRAFEETLTEGERTATRKDVACRVDGDWRRLETTTIGEPAAERL